MEMQKKFQNKRLNKEDHKKIESTAKGVKASAAAVGVAAVVGVGIKKYGLKGLKDLAVAAAKSLLRL